MNCVCFFFFDWSVLLCGDVSDLFVYVVFLCQIVLSSVCVCLCVRFYLCSNVASVSV